jgi:hypothetical protein
MTMTETENSHLLVDRFGRWPSFRDAEVVRAKFERGGEDAPFLECDIYVFDMTDELDSKGYYLLKNKTLVTFRFCNIDLDYFHSWNNQNVLFDLEIGHAEETDRVEDKDRRIQVELSSIYGCGAKLKCSAIKILKVEDYCRDQPRSNG